MELHLIMVGWKSTQPLLVKLETHILYSLAVYVQLQNMCLGQVVTTVRKLGRLAPIAQLWSYVLTATEINTLNQTRCMNALYHKIIL